MTDAPQILLDSVSALMQPKGITITAITVATPAPLPASARARAIIALDAERRVAVVGRMAELGAEGPEEHRRVGERLAAAGVDVIAFDVPEYGGTLVSTIEEATAAVGTVGAGTAVLVKASRVAGLERLAEALTA